MLRGIIETIKLCLEIRKEVLSMTFGPTSPITKAWVSMIVAGVYTREDVPNLYNLREAVYGVLDGMQ